MYAGGEAKWSTGTRNGDVLLLDGSKLVLKEGSRIIKQIYPVVADSDQLNTDQRMYAGIKLVSGDTTLGMQGDGNVVLKKGGTTQWSTKTADNQGAFMVLQGDGNMVVRPREGGKTLYASNTRGATRLKLTSDSLQLLDGDELVKQLWPAE